MLPIEKAAIKRPRNRRCVRGVEDGNWLESEPGHDVRQCVSQTPSIKLGKSQINLKPAIYAKMTYGARVKPWTQQNKLEKKRQLRGTKK